MTNKHHREAVAILHVLQQVQNLSLDAHIERAYGLVTNQHPRLERQTASNADALTLPTREFVRATIEHQFGLQPNVVQQFMNHRQALFFGATIPCGEWLVNEVFDSHSRIER